MSTLPPKPETGSVKQRATPAVPRASATIIVINANNEILLVHRNPKSTSFANAHVFPGGNYDKKQDEGRGLAFTAIRELFEESGLLLVDPRSSGIMPCNEDLDTAREAIHSQKRLFGDFLSQHNLRPNTKSLLPFTQWITPPHVPKRFHAQFYVVFLSSSNGEPACSAGFSSGDKQERLPTPDGGQEVIAARFVHPAHALAECRAQRIALFPPQYYLLHTLADVLDGPRTTLAQRARVRTLSEGAFGRMVVRPRALRDLEAERNGFMVLTYEGDETYGGSPGRRHRCRFKAGQGGAATYLVLERNFDIFSEIEEHAFSKPAPVKL